MTTLTNQRKQFDVESNSENLKLTGTVTYTDKGEVKDFNGNISSLNQEEETGFNAWFNYNETDGVVDSDSQNGVPVEYNAEACGLIRSTVSDIKSQLSNNQ